LTQARPSLTGLFFTLYVGIIYLVCMNVIIGIVTLYFDEVSDRHGMRLLRLAAEFFFSPVLSLCDRDRDACLSLLLASDVWLQHELDQVHHDLKYADKWKLSTMSFEAHLLQRLSYVITCMSFSISTWSTHRVTLCTCASLRFVLRRLKAKAKRLGRHCSALSSHGSRAASAEEEAEETEFARRDNQFSQGWVIRVSGDWYLPSICCVIA
jgi:hypothetical protein